MNVPLKASTPDTNTDSKNQQYVDYEIDIFQILSLLWRARLWMAGGIVAGLCITLLYWLFASTTYQTKIPVSIDVTSLPAITDTKLIVEGYNSALAAPKVASAAFNTIIKQSAGFAQALEDKGLKAETLVSQQVLQDPSKRSALVPLKLSSGISSTEFFIETRFPIKGMAKQASQLILEAINAAGKTYNSSIWEQRKTSAAGTERELRESFGALQHKLEPLLAQQTSSELSIRSAISQIEYELEREANAAKLFLPRSTDLVLDISSNSKQDMGPVPVFVTEKQMLRVLRLKSALASEKKLSAEKVKEIDNRLAEIQKNSEMLNNQFAPLFGSLRSFQTQMAEIQKELVLPVDRKTMLLPLFVANEMLSAEATLSGNAEVKTNGLSMVLFGSLFLGVLLSFMAFFIKTYAIKNIDKLKEIMGK